MGSALKVGRQPSPRSCREGWRSGCGCAYTRQRGSHVTAGVSAHGAVCFDFRKPCRPADLYQGNRRAPSTAWLAP